MYQIIDHTADIGIKVEAKDLEQLFVDAAAALTDLLITQKREYIPSIDVPIEIRAPALDQLLVRWLQEMLFVFETRRLVLSKFWVDEISERHLLGDAKGIKFDPTRHEQKLAIKAVTYHQLKVEKTPSGLWQAQVIFDI